MFKTLHTKFLLGMFALFSISCSSVENNDIPVQRYSDSTLYQKSDFVEHQGNIYRANTAVRAAAPNLYTASAEAPLNPWKRSSIQEVRSASKSSSAVEIPTWNSATIYNAEDVVSRNSSYYKSMWWNQNNDPNLDENKNNYTDVKGITHWGPWVTITYQEALEIVSSNNNSSNNGSGNGSGEGSGNESGNGSGNPGTSVPGTGNIEDASPGLDPGPPALTQEMIEKNTWSETAVYLENYVTIINNRFFRAKWWNQNVDPLSYFEFSWDSPWQEITEARFLQLVNGTTPPVVQPIPPDTGDNNGNNNGGGTVTPPTPVDPEYSEIVARGYIQEWSWDELPKTLKDGFNKASLNGSDIFASNGESAVRLFSSKMNANRWELLFPRRRGSKGWKDNNPGVVGVDDYYSYDNFVSALKIIGDYAYLIEVALDHSGVNETSFEKNYVLHKPSRTVRLINQSSDYFAPNNDWLTSRPHKLKVIDYAAFGSEGTENDKVRGIAGFLAHASHETSGSWATAPGFAFDKTQFPSANFPSYITTELPGELAWSLYFNEEVHYADNPNAIGYRQEENKIFPPAPGKSYHGRGAFQLSWNYNYGLASAIFFGTSKVLLEKPEMVVKGGVVSDGWIKGTSIDGGTMAFLTSLMFWLTPQGAKPSQQDTMILNRNDGLYIAGTAKLTEHKGLGTPGYGWTINIMNGGFEAGKSWEESHPKFDAKVARRVKHYLFFTQAFGGDNSDEILDTVGNHPY